MNATYGIGKSVPLRYEQAVARTREALQEEGFGVLTEIDVQATLKKKLDVNFKKYVILGACNPPLAWQEFQAEPDIGLLLPCNVIIYEEGRRKAEWRCSIPSCSSALPVATTSSPSPRKHERDFSASLTRCQTMRNPSVILHEQ